MKRKLLSGNYKTLREAEVDKELPETASDEREFELAVLAKLGGSIAFVRGRKLIEK